MQWSYVTYTSPDFSWCAVFWKNGREIANTIGRENANKIGRENVNKIGR